MLFIKRIVLMLVLIIRRALFAAVFLSLPYLATAFITWSPHPADWGWIWRCVTVILTVGAAVFLFTLIAEDPHQRKHSGAFNDV